MRHVQYAFFVGEGFAVRDGLVCVGEWGVRMMRLGDVSGRDVSVVIIRVRVDEKER